MNEMIKLLYENVVQEVSAMHEGRKKMDAEIERILQKEHLRMETSTYEAYRDKLYHVAKLAEEGGFIIGFKCAVNLMTECYASKEVIEKLE